MNEETIDKPIPEAAAAKNLILIPWYIMESVVRNNFPMESLAQPKELIKYLSDADLLDLMVANNAYIGTNGTYRVASTCDNIVWANNRVDDETRKDLTVLDALSNDPARLKELFYRIDGGPEDYEFTTKSIFETTRPTEYLPYSERDGIDLVNIDKGTDGVILYRGITTYQPSLWRAVSILYSERHSFDTMCSVADGALIKHLIQCKR